MTASEINTFLSGTSDVEMFKKSIDDEVTNYSMLLTKTGSTIPLIFVEDETVNLNGTKLKKLIKTVLNGELSAIHLSYICDCFTLSESIIYENDALNEIIYDIADPEINGGYKSIQDLNEIIELINKIN